MVGAMGTPHRMTASGLPTTDRLTGLGTVEALRQTISQIADERASDPAPFTVGILNLDGFRPINDLFGPEAGDDILCQVAARLLACVPDGASVMRTGGDEFAIVLPYVFERKTAEKVGVMLKEVLSAPSISARAMCACRQAPALPSTPLPQRAERALEECGHRALSLQAPRPRAGHRLFPRNRAGNAPRHADGTGAAQCHHRQ